MENYIVHTSGGTRIFSKKELIENALMQEKEGIKPSFAWRFPEGPGPAGWLVWSTWEDGAGVVVRREDGCFYVLRGWQGEFTIV